MSSHELSLQGAGVQIAAEYWDAADDSPRGTMLLLHGGGQTRHSWDRSAARFAAGGWTTYTYDARGHGDSAWAPDGDYGMDTLVADLRAIVDTLDGPVVLVGASMGGLTALVAEGEGAGLARALVLVDVAPKTEEAGVLRILEFMSSHLDGFASLEEVADAIAGYNPHRPRPRNLDGLKKNVRLREDGRWYWHWDPEFLTIRDEAARQVSESRLEAAARGITVPTMLVRGTDSDVVSASGALALQQLIPSARVVEASAGHMVAGDDNDIFTHAVSGFLDEVLTG
jgi:pimeloyl-ACP methyl ester carboxylesterase